LKDGRGRLNVDGFRDLSDIEFEIEFRGLRHFQGDFDGLRAEAGLGDGDLVGSRVQWIDAVVAGLVGGDFSGGSGGHALHADGSFGDDGVLRVSDIADDGGRGGLCAK
jgi:hypothetical protein